MEYFEKYAQGMHYCEGGAELYFGPQDAIAIRDICETVFGLHIIRILDAGSANGFSTHLLRNLGMDAVGIEICPEMHAQTLECVRPYNILGSITKLPFAPNSFDVVWTSALTYLPTRKQVQQALKEFARVGDYLIAWLLTEDEAQKRNVYDAYANIRMTCSGWVAEIERSGLWVEDVANRKYGMVFRRKA